MRYETGTEVFGDWKIVREIGEGSNGIVYELQKTNGRVLAKSALKVIQVPKSSADITAALCEGMDERSVTTYFQGKVDRILKEVAIMIEIKSHPNIVSCEDYRVISHAGDIGWDILIRMELLTPIEQYMQKHPVDENTVRKIGIDLCNGLAFCQKKGLIHRDIKPGNIFFCDTGQFKLGDFGEARSLQKTMGGLTTRGTFSYMAPEVYHGKPYGPRVDIYSLGMVLYKYMNNNRLPFYPQPPEPIRYEDDENALIQRMKGDPLPIPGNASPEFWQIIEKACAYKPEDRFTSAAEMKEALETGYMKGKQKLKEEEEPKNKDEKRETVEEQQDWEEDEKTISINNDKAHLDKKRLDEERKTKKSGLKIGLGVVCAVLAAIMVGGFFVNQQIQRKEKIEAESRAAAESEAESRAAAESEAESRAAAESEAESRAAAESEAESRAAAESEAESRAAAESEAESRAAAESEAESKAAAESEAESRAAAESEAESRAAIEREKEAKRVFREQLLAERDATSGTYMVTAKSVSMNGAETTTTETNAISIPKKTFVYVIKTDESEKRKKIVYGGQIGWLEDAKLELLSEEDLSIQEGSRCYVNTEPGDEKSVVELRASADESAEVLKRLPYGSEVLVEEVADDWLKVTCGDQTGWMEWHQKNEQGEKTSEAALATYAEGCYYYADVTSGLRMRDKADVDSSEVGTLHIGNTVEVKKYKSGWGKVTYKGKTGWVALKYMTPCKDADGGAQYETEAPVAAPPVNNYTGGSSGGGKKSSGSGVVIAHW